MKTHPFIAALTLPNVSVPSPDASASELGSDTGTFRVTRVGVTNSPLTASYVVRPHPGPAGEPPFGGSR